MSFITFVKSLSAVSKYSSISYIKFSSIYFDFEILSLNTYV